MPSYDLSQPIADGMTVYPGDPPVDVTELATIEVDGYRQTALTIDSHTGTHIDAPAHMIDDGRRLAEFPIETFRFAARRVDCTGLDPRAEIAVDALAAGRTADHWEAVDLLVVQTGWDDHWNSDQYFAHPFVTTEAADWLVDHELHLAIDAPNVDPTPPFVTTEAADWLVDHELHLAIDAPNVDPTPTDSAGEDEPAGYPVHRRLLGDGRLLIENLCGLSCLPDRFELHAYPLSIRGNGDGAPVRAVAVVDE